METDDEPTTSQAKDIKRVANDTVHKICSSQVIGSLKDAVKELVENSIDAKATVVEIKIKNYGADGFEVLDNGIGISEENFAGITAKHHTSKLKDFSDLESIKSFGFRGEALSSLCALSKVSVTTRVNTSEHGTKLLFDHDGAIAKKAMCARNVGTTVSITDFFVTLPVRRGEFMKNYKKDYGKMIQLLQGYCLVLTDIKIICTNQPSNGARQTVLSTRGSSVMDNIISVFGPIQAKELIKIKCPTDDQTEDGVYTQESLADLDISNGILDVKQFELDSLNTSQFKIEGFISKIDHNCARPSKDRQFFNINSRPIELNPVSKIVNEVFRRYNSKQFPFVYLNLKMHQSNVDVNLSKDKRQVAIWNEHIFCLAVKRSLLNTFGELSTKFKRISINNSVKKYQPVDSDEDEGDKITIVEPSSNFGGSLSQWRVNPHDPIPQAPTHKRKSSNEPKGQRALKLKPGFYEKSQGNNSFKIEDLKENSPKIRDDGRDASFRIDCKTRKSLNTLKFEIFNKSSNLNDLATDQKSQVELSQDTQLIEKTFIDASQPMSDDESSFRKSPASANNLTNGSKSQPETVRFAKQSFNDANQLQSDDESESELALDQTVSRSTSELTANASSSFSLASQNEVTLIDERKPDIIKNSSKIKVSLESIRTMIKAEEDAADEICRNKKSRKLKLRFKESIDPSKNKKAEAELETEIKKEMFEEMEVLGQFNLGFIIAKLNSDLFIVDQHASDEKYNFEDLQSTTKLETQPLVVSEKLELTAIQEMTLIENLKTFEMNGFKFLIDESASAGNKIKIHSKPFSKKWEFGREDIEEMIFMLDDAPNCVCRPSRIRTMLASRACRKSIMIGDALTKKQMKKLLENMGKLDHPWNCPHGRPTLRYLQNLDMIDKI